MRPVYIVQTYGPDKPDPDGGGMRLCNLLNARRVPRGVYEEAVARGATVEAVGRYHYARENAPPALGAHGEGRV